MSDQGFIIRPEEIETRSMELIGRGMTTSGWTEGQLKVVKRCIHTSADFDYERNLVFSGEAVETAVRAFQSGAPIVTDTNMAAAGINRAAAGRWGVQIHCFMAEAEVAAEAKKRGITRAAVCMERGAALDIPAVFAIGNAPTALLRLYELMKTGWRPALIIGVPVGFVNVTEAKDLICSLDVPYIVAKGRKGGSNIAAAICNALLYQIADYG